MNANFHQQQRSPSWYLRLALCSLFVAGSVVAKAQIEILPPREPQIVFAGVPQKIEVIFRNATDKPVQMNLSTRIFQTSSSTVTPVGEAQFWKDLEVLPEQMVMDNAMLTFPEVRAITVFQVRWLDEKTNEVGRTTVRVCPPDLLKQLSAEAGDKRIGLLDPENLLKPILEKIKVPLDDLEKNAGFDSFDGKLAIVGPFSSKEKMPANLKTRLTSATAKKPLTILWLQPPGIEIEPLPNFYFVRESAGTIAIVKEKMISHLAESPHAQINLLRCVRLAQHPETLTLP